jgi:hypothetical protein
VHVRFEATVESLLEALDGLLEPTQHLECLPECRMCGPQVMHVPDGDLSIVERRLIASLTEVRIAAVAVDLGIVASERDGAVVVLEGAGQILTPFERAWSGFFESAEFSASTASSNAPRRRQSAPRWT